ncbi:unnamed protein product [Amoebophrya sp. A120]|nr:unnamed protein product [Amoebophrya sp. A120]|eukprot:GSA120T00002812001.1
MSGVTAAPAASTSGAAPAQEVGETAKQLLTIGVADNNRAKCRYCLEPLKTGDRKVTMEAFMLGRTCVISKHLNCFVEKDVSIEIADRGNAGACKRTKEKLQKGQPRFVIYSIPKKPECGGNGSRFFLSMQGASALSPVLRQYVADNKLKEPANLNAILAGFSSLPADIQVEVTQALGFSAASTSANSKLDKSSIARQKSSDENASAQKEKGKAANRAAKEQTLNKQQTTSTSKNAKGREAKTTVKPPPSRKAKQTSNNGASSTKKKTPVAKTSAK